MPGVKVRVVREETNSYGDMVGELLGYGRNLCMGYLNKVSLRLTVSLRIQRMADSCDCPIKGTVRPDWICMRVVSLESPFKGHQPAYVLNFLFLILNICKNFKVLSRFMQK